MIDEVFPPEKLRDLLDRISDLRYEAEREHLDLAVLDRIEGSRGDEDAGYLPMAANWCQSLSTSATSDI
jgi:hypothetical protein